jgi:hypothetical protein
MLLPVKQNASVSQTSTPFGCNQPISLLFTEEGGSRSRVHSGISQTSGFTLTKATLIVSASSTGLE